MRMAIIITLVVLDRRQTYLRPCDTTGVPSAQRLYNQNIEHGTSAPVRQLGSYHGGVGSDRLANTLRRGAGWVSGRSHGERGHHTSL